MSKINTRLKLKSHFKAYEVNAQLDQLSIAWGKPHPNPHCWADQVTRHFACTHLYSWLERGTLKINWLVQKQSSVTSASAWTQVPTPNYTVIINKIINTSECSVELYSKRESRIWQKCTEIGKKPSCSGISSFSALLVNLLAALYFVFLVHYWSWRQIFRATCRRCAVVRSKIRPY